ncbi:MAG: HD domain-containing protein [Deltaproteobacteria bacterium]|nr:HD domain-containing protein [Deltaproteobacteria bacterium]
MVGHKDDTNWARFITQVFEQAKPYLAVRGDLMHARISHEYAMSLMKQEGGDRKIIEPAIILHDVGWSCLGAREIKTAYGVKAEGLESERLNRIHEKEGAAVARRILEHIHYDPLLIDKIASIIRTHDSGEDIRSLEEAVVKDADKLWRFSETGFSKEIERQGITAIELYRHLAEHHETWFCTQSAFEIAARELEKRKRQSSRKV